MSIRTIGLDETVHNLGLEIVRMKKVTQAGLIAGGFRILRNAQERVPVQLGNLRSSGFIVWGATARYGKAYKGDDAEEIRAGVESTVAEARKDVTSLKISTGGSPTVEIGFGAYYALYVHEGVKASHDKLDKKSGETRRIGEAHFLSKAVESQGPMVLEDIRKAASI